MHIAKKLSLAIGGTFLLLMLTIAWEAFSPPKYDGLSTTQKEMLEKRDSRKVTRGSLEDGRAIYVIYEGRGAESRITLKVDQLPEWGDSPRDFTPAERERFEAAVPVRPFWLVSYPYMEGWQYRKMAWGVVALSSWMFGVVLVLLRGRHQTLIKSRHEKKFSFSARLLPVVVPAGFLALFASLILLRVPTIFTEVSLFMSTAAFLGGLSTTLWQYGSMKHHRVHANKNTHTA